MPQLIPQGYPLFMARIGKDAPVPEVRVDVLVVPVIGWDAENYGTAGILKPIAPSPYGRSEDYAEPYSILNDGFTFSAVGFGTTPEQAEEAARRSFKENLPRFQKEFEQMCAEEDSAASPAKD